MSSAGTLFNRSVVGIKLGAMALLTGLAYKQGDVSFISKHPRTFLMECIMIGASAAVPSLFMAYTRRDRATGLDESKTITAISLVFMLFFIFHLLMELSGMNNIESAANTEDKEQQAFLHKYVLNDFTFSIMVCGAAFMNVLAHKARSKSKFNQDEASVALFEMLLFGAANAIPYYNILKARGATKDTKMKALRMGSLFCFSYTLLETGGFFSHIFDANTS